MNYLEIIKIGSNLLKKNQIQSHILDSEILLSKTINRPREEILTNLNQKINDEKILTFNEYL